VLQAPEKLHNVDADEGEDRGGSIAIIHVAQRRNGGGEEEPELGAQRPATLQRTWRGDLKMKVERQRRKKKPVFRRLGREEGKEKDKRTHHHKRLSVLKDRVKTLYHP